MGNLLITRMIIEYKALGVVQSATGFYGNVIRLLGLYDVEHETMRKETKRLIFLAGMRSSDDECQVHNFAPVEEPLT